MSRCLIPNCLHWTSNTWSPLGIRLRLHRLGACGPIVCNQSGTGGQWRISGRTQTASVDGNGRSKQRMRASALYLHCRTPPMVAYGRGAHRQLLPDRRSILALADVLGGVWDAVLSIRADAQGSVRPGRLDGRRCPGVSSRSEIVLAFPRRIAGKDIDHGFDFGPDVIVKVASPTSQVTLLALARKCQRVACEVSSVDRPRE